MANSVDLLQGTLDLLVLRTLSSGAMHGWGISQRIQQVSEDVLRVNQGVALSRPPPARGPGPHRGRVGRVGERPSREVLLVDARGAKAPRPRKPPNGSGWPRRSLASWKPREADHAHPQGLKSRLRALVPRRRARAGDERRAAAARRARDREEPGPRPLPGRGATGGARQLRRRRIREGSLPGRARGTASSRTSGRTCPTPSAASAGTPASPRW